jgi:tetratricopeptide (TPR) repeat protein
MEPTTIASLAVNGLAWVFHACMTGVVANWSDRRLCATVLGLKHRMSHLRGLPENHDVARAVRVAHLQALDRVIRDYRDAPRRESLRVLQADRDVFLDGSVDYCARALRRSQDATLDLTEALVSAIDAVLAPPEGDWPADERADALAARAEDAVLEELRAGLSGVEFPEGFEHHFRNGTTQERPRFLELFGAYIREQLKDNRRFRDIFTGWQLSRTEALAFDTRELVSRMDQRFGQVLVRLEAAIGDVRVTQDAQSATLAKILDQVSAVKGIPARPTAADILSSGTSTRPPEVTNPGTLLHPRFEVVTFIDDVRQAELAILRGWCAAPDPVSVRLFVGPGGSGKTRLFIEWTRQLRESGWHAGFLSDRASEDDARVVFDSPQATFVVTDYAETRKTLHRLLEAAAARPRDGRGPLRMALLARGPGDWWVALTQQSPPISDLLLRDPPVPLSPVGVEGAQRSRVFERSAAAFATIRGRPVPTQEVNLSDPRFGRVLYVAMAALAVVEGLPPDAHTLLSVIVEHEQHYWAYRYRDVHAGDVLDAADFLARTARLVGGVTLRGGVATREDAESLARAVEGPTTRHILPFLHGLYAHPDVYVGPLEPDLLGEALIAQVLSHADTRQDYLVRAFDGADERALQHGFSRLGQIAMHAPGQRGRVWIEQVLGVDVPGRARAAFEAALSLSARTAHSPLGRVLHEALERQGTAELAREFERCVPKQTVSLRQVAAWATARVRQELPSDETAEAALVERARLSNNLGAWLNALGQHEEARDAAEEAVRHYHMLIVHRPDGSFLPELATSLNTLGVVLSDLGQLNAARRAIEEAVAIAMEEQPNLFLLPTLARSLKNLGAVLGDLGEHEAARFVTEQAVEHYRTLMQLRRDGFFRPELAGSLIDVGSTFGELGQRGAVRFAAQEAAGIGNTLAEEQPDAFLPGLASSLTTLAAVLSGLGRREEARDAAEEAVRHCRGLVQQVPDAFLPELATSLNTLALSSATWGAARRRATPPRRPLGFGAR